MMLSLSIQSGSPAVVPAGGAGMPRIGGGSRVCVHAQLPGEPRCSALLTVRIPRGVVQRVCLLAEQRFKQAVRHVFRTIT